MECLLTNVHDYFKDMLGNFVEIWGTSGGKFGGKALNDIILHINKRYVTLEDDILHKNRFYITKRYFTLKS